MSKSQKPSDAQQVATWMNNLHHPLKEGVELLRTIIKQSDERIKERIKWNAPSYYYQDDIVTMGPMKKDKLLLVFHHPHIVNISASWLEGEYKDRRLAWFDSVNDIREKEKEIIRVMKEMIGAIE